LFSFNFKQNYIYRTCVLVRQLAQNKNSCTGAMAQLNGILMTLNRTFVFTT